MKKIVIKLAIFGLLIGVYNGKAFNGTDIKNYAAANREVVVTATTALSYCALLTGAKLFCDRAAYLTFADEIKLGSLALSLACSGGLLFSLHNTSAVEKFLENFGRFNRTKIF